MAGGQAPLRGGRRRSLSAFCAASSPALVFRPVVTHEANKGLEMALLKVRQEHANNLALVIHSLATMEHALKDTNERFRRL
jgi:hypothetical protein